MGSEFVVSLAMLLCVFDHSCGDVAPIAVPRFGQCLDLQPLPIRGRDDAPRDGARFAFPCGDGIR